MPWFEMARRPTEARRSVLLDYVSPMLLIAFWRALKNRHVIILITIVVFAQIKVLTVVSTGLFALQDYQAIDVPVQLTATKRFDGANFAHGANVDTRPTYILYGIEKLNLTYPFGTTSAFAYQPFNSTQANPNRIALSGTVDVFSAGLDCELGHLRYTSRDPGEIAHRAFDTSGDDMVFNVNVSTSSCNITDAHVELAAALYVYDASDPRPPYAFYGRVQNVQCGSSKADNDSSRLLIIFANQTYPNGSKPLITNSANLVCTPTYNISKGLVRLDDVNSESDTTPKITFPLEQSSRMLAGVSAWDIASASLDKTLDALVVELIPSLSNEDVTLDYFLTYAATTMPNIRPTDFMNPATLEKASRRLLSTLSSLLAKDFLMVPSSDIFVGNETRIEQRLFVRSLPVRLLQGILGSVILLTLLLAVRIPRNAITRAPGSIAATASILAFSPSIVELLKHGSGTLEEKDLVVRMSSHKFATTRHLVNGCPSFGITTTGEIRQSVSQAADPPVKSPGRIKWYRPWAFTPTLMVITLLLPLLLIVALEVLYQNSAQHNGIADIPSNGLIRYTWLYIPTFVLVLVATLFNMLDFEVESMQPFYELHKGSSQAGASILNYPLGNMTVRSLWNGLKNRQLAVSASAAAALFAPLLTIVASGLYTDTNVPQIRQPSVQVLDTWNSSFSDTWRAAFATEGVISSLIVSNNLSYPQWTYEELAIPKFRIEPSHTSSSNTASDLNATSLSIRVPAVRGGMNCSVVPPSRLPGSTVESLDGRASQSYGINLTVPETCGPNLVYNASRYLQFYSSLPDDGYFGRMLYLGGEGGWISNACYFFGFGHGSATAGKVDNFTALLCAPYVQQIEADTVMSLPEYSIDALRPPIPDESTLRFLSNTSIDMTGDCWQILNLATPQYDAFFQAILFGYDAVAPDTLLDPSKLIKSVTHTYRILMAQILNSQFRLPTSDSHNLLLLNATTTNPYHARLQQSELSTRLLEGLLAFLFICAATAYLAMNTRRILPCNPHSIAAIGSILVGSQLLNRTDEDKVIIPQGAEWMSNSEMKKRRVFDGYMFSLGWWTGDGRLERRGGEDSATIDENRTSQRYGIDAQSLVTQTMNLSPECSQI
jgi:hypothetical protein